MIGYHYCSVDTFVRILRGKQLFLSDPLKMNDYMELIWFLELLKKEKDEYGDFSELISLISKVDFSVDELINSIKQAGQSNCFISCFSQNSDLLSQWRAYGSNGEGVAIGFDLDHLCNINPVNCYKVHYTDIIEKQTKTNLVLLAGIIKGYKREDNRRNLLLNSLVFNGICYKNPAFIEECEYRIAYLEKDQFEKLLSNSRLNNNGNRTASNKLPHEFRVSGSNVIEYVNMKLDASAIKEVVIGPKSQINENDAERVLKHFGVNANIIKSKASYR